MQERRQVPRWDVWQSVRIRAGQQGAVAAVIRDLSLKGMRVSLASELLVQPMLKLTIDLTESVQLNAGAQVRWQARERDAYVYGLAFHVISDDDKDRLCQYLQSHCQRQWKDRLRGGEADPARGDPGELDDPIQALDDLIDSFESGF